MYESMKKSVVHVFDDGLVSVQIVYSTNLRNAIECNKTYNNIVVTRNKKKEPLYLIIIDIHLMRKLSNIDSSEKIEDMVVYNILNSQKK